MIIGKSFLTLKKRNILKLVSAQYAILSGGVVSGFVSVYDNLNQRTSVSERDIEKGVNSSHRVRALFRFLGQIPTVKKGHNT